MSKYEIIYDYCSQGIDEYCSDEEHNIREEFEGTWDELQEYLKQMKNNGCYNIDVSCIDEE